ncbi:pentapeptide repeat-containing protein [Nonomuraea sp. LPB2021202275-12-8]|uniref:pentapeptide repeat-containing protein n=1 Tax=Nonomuraea sp. LPB2021202275-12-8 TaxID=3120159 RepID=UPI003FA53B91
MWGDFVGAAPRGCQRGARHPRQARKRSIDDHLSETDLAWADLTGADLAGADLRGTDLSETKGLSDSRLLKKLSQWDATTTF